MSGNNMELFASLDEKAMAAADRDELRILSDVVASIGLDVAAGATKLTKSHLVQALKGEPGRYLDASHRRRILRFASREQRIAYANVGLKSDAVHAAPIRTRTAEQRLRDLEYRIAVRFGEAGDELVQDERSKP